MSTYSKQISRTTYYAGLLFLLFVAIAVRIPGGLSSLIRHDEFFHYFAGLSYIRDGTLAIGEGRYTRAAPYTVLTGLSMKVFGINLLALRLPSIVSGTLLVIVVAWCLGRVRRVAGLIGGTMLAVDDVGIQLSDYARFYTLHALMVWIAAVSSYALLTRRHPQIKTLFILIALAGSLALALNLQVLTLFFIVALCVWAGMDYTLFSSPSRALIVGKGMVGLVLIIGLLLIATTLLTPVGSFIISLYRKFWTVAPWSEDRKDDFLFYLRFMSTYGFLGYAFPIAVIPAWRIDQRLTVFCTILFVIPMLLTSIGPQKSSRYIFYAIPFFVSVWGLAGTWLVSEIRRIARLHSASSWQMAIIMAGTLLVLIGSTNNFRSTVGRMGRFALTGEVVPLERLTRNREFDWRPWMPFLKQVVSHSEILISSDDLRTLYHFGRIDFILNRSIQSDISSREFTIDPRIGVPAISQPNSIKLVITCTLSGVIIVPYKSWRDVFSVIPATADSIEEHATQVPLPQNVPFKLFKWHNSSVSPSQPCQRLAARMQ